MHEPLINNTRSLPVSNTLSIFIYAYRYTFEPVLLKETLNAFNERYLELISHFQLDMSAYCDNKFLETVRKTFKSILISRPQIIKKTNKSSNFATLLGQSLAHYSIAFICEINPFIEFQQEPNAWILPLPPLNNIQPKIHDIETIQNKFKQYRWDDLIIQIEFKINDSFHDFTLKK